MYDDDENEENREKELAKKLNEVAEEALVILKKMQRILFDLEMRHGMGEMGDKHIDECLPDSLVELQKEVDVKLESIRQVAKEICIEKGEEWKYQDMPADEFFKMKIEELGLEDEEDEDDD
jgi:hypothetical protein